MKAHNLVRTVRPDLVVSLALMIVPFLLLVAAVDGLRIYFAEYAKFGLAALRGGPMAQAATNEAQRLVGEAVARPEKLEMPQVLRAEPGPFVKARRNPILEGLGLAGRDATGNVYFKVNTAPYGSDPVWEDISEAAIKKVNDNAQRAQYEAWVRKLGGEKAKNLKGLKDYEDQALRLVGEWDAGKIPGSKSFTVKQESPIREALHRSENDYKERVEEILGGKSTSGSSKPSEGSKPSKGFFGALGSGTKKMFSGVAAPARALGRFPGTKYNLDTAVRIGHKTPVGGVLAAMIGCAIDNHYGGNVRYAEGAYRRAAASAAHKGPLVNREIKRGNLVNHEANFAEYAKFGLAVLCVWLVYRGLRLLVKWAGAKYQIFDDVVVASFGIVSRRSTQVRVADIRGMSVRQSLVGRLLGVGDVTIGTAATGDAEIVMRGVRNPSGIVAAIDGLR